MATEQRLITITLPSSADLSSAGQYRAVRKNASGEIALATAGARADGILQDKPEAQGQAASVAVLGRSKAEAGGVFAADALLTPGTGGKLVEAGTGDVAIGTSIEASAADGDVVSILLNPQLEAPT